MDTQTDDSIANRYICLELDGLIDSLPEIDIFS